MSLDWSNERYVRLYTKETPDEAVWCWQAIALWPQLLRKAERNGELRTKKGLVGIAALTRIPHEVVMVAMDDLLADGCIVETERGYAIPNYIEAQTAQASDTKRKADQRARDRLDDVLSRNAGNKSVTRGHEDSREVTSGHSDPSGAGPSGTEEEAPNGSAPLVLIPAPEPKTTRKPSRPHQEAVDHFHRRYLERTGQKPTWKGKNSALMAALVTAHGAPEVKRRTDIAYDAPPAFLAGQVIDVGTLSAHFDKFAVEAKATGPPLRVVPGIRSIPDL